MRKHVVKYPSSIKRYCLQVSDFAQAHPTVAMLLEKAKVPQDTLYTWMTERGHVMFHIVLSDGRIFTGLAIKRPNEENDTEKALVVAAGRALAVWRSTLNTGGLITYYLRTPHFECKIFGENITDKQRREMQKGIERVIVDRMRIL